jgi:valyl-tRNA synthetase
MRFYTERCEAMRNFANKIWNASRFLMMNLTIEDNALPEKLELEDQWILSKLNTVIAEVTENMDHYELGVAAQKLYDFIWDTYCDWYIEMTKPRLQGEDEGAKEQAQRVLCYVLTDILKLLHPFMPFITEEIWQALPHEGDFLMLSHWPKADPALSFPAEERAMEQIMAAINAVRSRRAEMNVPPSKKAHLTVVTADAAVFEAGRPFLMRLAGAEQVTVSPAVPASTEGMVSVVTADAQMYIPLAELVDLEKERARVAKELEQARANLQRIEGKLANESFVSKAPEAVVNAERERAEKARSLIAQLEETAAGLR